MESCFPLIETNAVLLQENMLKVGFIQWSVFESSVFQFNQCFNLSTGFQVLGLIKLWPVDNRHATNDTN